MFNNMQRQILAQPILAVIAIPNSMGMPHMTPVWFVEHEEKLYFSSDSGTMKIKLLNNTEKIGVTIVDPSGKLYVSVFGHAKIMTKNNFNNFEEIIGELIDRYIQDEEKRRKTKDSLISNENRVLVEITPSKVYPVSR